MAKVKAQVRKKQRIKRALEVHRFVTGKLTYDLLNIWRVSEPTALSEGEAKPDPSQNGATGSFTVILTGTCKSKVTVGTDSNGNHTTTTTTTCPNGDGSETVVTQKTTTTSETRPAQ